MLKLQSECSLFRADESPFLSDEISKVMLARSDLSVWEAGVFGITMQRTEKDGVNKG